MVSLAIRELEKRDDLTPEDIDAFITEHNFPLVEDDRVTFVYRGEADEVHLRHWIFSLPSTQNLQRIRETDLWYRVVELPENSRVEYKFEVIRNGKSEWVIDPLNDALAHDPFGANSVATSAGYEYPMWVEPDHHSRPGHIQDVIIGNTPFGEPRRVTIYLPARFKQTRRYRLLIVHDGGDYLRFARMKTVLDNLIHRLEIQPVIAAFTHPGNRLQEYPNDSKHTSFIAETLVPKLEERFPLMGTPTSRCLMGASFGAVASLATAWRYPGMFGRLLLQSGSFAFTDIGDHQRGPAFDPVVEFINAFREAPGKPSERVYMSCGIYESLIYENRSMYPFLQKTGMNVRYEENRDGHNWENWRDRLQTALSWLFPGPLWMMYE